MKVLISADHHVGANKFGTNNEKWGAPLVELVDYAIENSVDAVAFAGDMFHHRRPTTWASQFVHHELKRLVRSGIWVLGAKGNHDDSVTAGSVPATWHLSGTWANKVPVRTGDGKVNIVLLPWVTPQAYDAPLQDTLADQLEWAQSAALDTLKFMRQPDAVNILIGHAMVAYGPGADDLAPSPGLQWAGKDCVFDYNTLSKGFDATFLGHVHDPRMEGYVGSSQPTDWGDAGQVKSFILFDTENMGGEIVIPYKTSLKLLDVNDMKSQDGMGFHSGMGGALDFKYDVGRFRLFIPAGTAEPTPEDLAEIRAKMEAVCDRVESIEVTRDRTVVARVTTDMPLAAMRPEDAVEAWLTHAGTDATTAAGVRAKFADMVATK